MDTKIAALILGLLSIGADGAERRSADQASLKEYGRLVGEWRGTGQLQRGSARGAWTEKAEWSWKLTNDSAALSFTSPDGKHLRTGLLRPGVNAKEFVLDATLPDGSKRQFSGKLGLRNIMSLNDLKHESGGVARITITPLHDTRFLMELESRDESGTFTKLGELGFTRQGVAFAAGDSSPVCIVTEGRGTIPVTYRGKTYYVCCSGCKDLFNDDPEGVLAETARRTKTNAK